MIKTCIICKKEYNVRGRRKLISKYCSRKCSSEGHKGHIAWNKGIKGSIPVNSGSFKKGHTFWLGKKRSEKDRKLMSDAQKRNPVSFWLGKKRPNISGERCNKWKGGITPIHEKERRTVEYKIWRRFVFSRDNYTCQKCFERGGSLIAHHITNFSKSIESRTAFENGITMCKGCHLEFHIEYGMKNNTQQQLYDFILNRYLISA